MVWFQHRQCNFWNRFLGHVSLVGNFVAISVLLKSANFVKIFRLQRPNPRSMKFFNIPIIHVKNVRVHTTCKERERAFGCFLLPIHASFTPLRRQKSYSFGSGCAYQTIAANIPSFLACFRQTWAWELGSRNVANIPCEIWYIISLVNYHLV